jgi:uncharacterized protein
MIKEIISFRRQGMSFRKIAEKLNSTVGKVHYQWKKSKKTPSEKRIYSCEDGMVKNKKIKIHETISQRQKDNYLVTRFISNHKIASSWKIADWQRQFVTSYFNIDRKQLVIVFRIYDVTDIKFNGSNAHTYYEFQLPEDKSYWLIKGIKATRCYLTEIGFRITHQHFFPVLRSNVVHGQLEIKESLSDELEALPKTIVKGPEWLERVSTYSYYGNINEVKDNNE